MGTEIRNRTRIADSLANRVTEVRQAGSHIASTYLTGDMTMYWFNEVYGMWEKPFLTECFKRAVCKRSESWLNDEKREAEGLDRLALDRPDTPCPLFLPGVSHLYGGHGML